jgi:hypothetical protein
MSALINDLTAMGFVEIPTGGGCMAMFRFDGIASDVITDAEGSELPERDDWLAVRYAGDWRLDADAPELEAQDSGESMVDLITLLRAGVPA